MDPRLSRAAAPLGISPRDDEAAPLQLVNEQVGAATASPQISTIEMDVPRAAVRGVAWLAGTHGLNQALAFGVFVLLSRLLSPSTFGLVAAANVLILLIRVLVGAGLSRALIQRPVLTAAQADTAFWTSVGIGLCLTAVTLAAAPAVADLFREPSLTPVVRVLSAVFVLASLDSTQSALVDRAMHFQVQALRRSSATLIGSAVAVGLALSGAGVWALVGQTLSYEVALVVGLWTLTTWRPRPRLAPSLLRELLGFGLNYLGVKILVYLSQNMDNFLVGWILGPLDLGLYVIAYRVLTVFTEVLGLTINQVALPMFARYQNDSERLHEAFYTAVELSATVGWPAFAGLAVVADQLMPEVFGAKWAQSGPVMSALCLAGLVQVAGIFTQNLLIATGNVGRELRWSLLATSVEIAGFAVAAPFGIVAVACSLAATTGLLWPIRVRQVARWTGFSPQAYAAHLAGPAAATAAMCLVVVATKVELSGTAGPSAVWIEMALGAAVYALALPLVARRAVGSLRLSVRYLRTPS